MQRSLMLEKRSLGLWSGYRQPCPRIADSSNESTSSAFGTRAKTSSTTVLSPRSLTQGKRELLICHFSNEMTIHEISSKGERSTTATHLLARLTSGSRSQCLTHFCVEASTHYDYEYCDLLCAVPHNLSCSAEEFLPIGGWAIVVARDYWDHERALT